ncbi:MAG: hypothetical protein ACRDV0_09310, partial [Acidimicrobiales bacterium]
MSHRSSTWWRGLGAALFSLAALAWPAPAGAAATPSFTLVHQSPAAVLGRSSSAHLDVALRLAKPDRHAVVQLSLFSRLVTRVALDPLLNGVGPVGTATSTTGNFTLTCDTAKDVHLVVTLSSGPSSGSSRCASRAPRLRLPCRGASCDGVYPLEYAVTSGGVETTTWSLVAVRTLHVAAPLHADVIFTLDPSALAHSSAARATLRELSRHASVPLAITADYRTLESVLAGPADATRAWRDALNAGLASALH